MTRFAVRARTGCPSSWRRSLLFPSIPEPWSSWTWITATWLRPGPCRLFIGFPGAGPSRASSDRSPRSSAALAPRVGSGAVLPVLLVARCPDSPLDRVAFRSLSLDQVTPYRQHGRLDGRPTLFAASLCLSLDGPSRIGPLGDLQSYGTPPAARHHDTRNACYIGLRAPARRNTGCGRLADELDLDQACSRCGIDRFSYRARPLARPAFGGPKSPLDRVFPLGQRAAHLGADRDRCSRCG